MSNGKMIPTGLEETLRRIGECRMPFLNCCRSRFLCLSAFTDLQNISSATGEQGDDVIRVLRELAADEKNVAHLTHVSEMQKKIETLSRITTILKGVIQNKDRIIARLQQPYSVDCIPVESEFQKQFSVLLMKAASDYGALTASVADLQWSQNFRESPSVWGEMLRPIPVASASCTGFFEAMSAMRESFATLQNLRVGNPNPSLPMPRPIDPSLRVVVDSSCITPPPWQSELSFDELAIRSLHRQEN
ncbi:AUGMIN subunit 2 [Cucurbita argyrosperma subsp. argyrosperma]|nr:AUGMIN subunit 2 [Cucurbita argyrosperma subsp. argyrosperma]